MQVFIILALLIVGFLSIGFCLLITQIYKDSLRIKLGMQFGIFFSTICSFILMGIAAYCQLNNIFHVLAIYAVASVAVILHVEVNFLKKKLKEITGSEYGTIIK